VGVSAADAVGLAEPLLLAVAEALPVSLPTAGGSEGAPDTVAVGVSAADAVGLAEPLLLAVAEALPVSLPTELRLAVALLLSLVSAAGAELALALPVTLPVGVAVALPDAVGDSGPNCALSSNTGAAANATSPACIATTSQRPPSSVGVSSSPATVHAAGVLLANDTGRKLELLQLRGNGAGGPQYGPPSGMQVMVCAAAPLANVMLAPPTVLQWPSSAARQVSAPNAPVNSVCQ
jgi:hypothetical protein